MRQHDTHVLLFGYMVYEGFVVLHCAADIDYRACSAEAMLWLVVPLARPGILVAAVHLANPVIAVTAPSSK